MFRSIIRRQPLASYFALTYAISWGGVVALAWPAGIPGDSSAVSKLFVPIALLNLAGPPIAALVVSFAMGGASEVRRLFSRGAAKSSLARFLAAALLTPAIGFLVLASLSVLTPTFTPGMLAAPSAQTVALGLTAGLAAGFVEEIGWTGFALRRMLVGRGLIGSALMIGVLHGLWHLPAGYWGEGVKYGQYFPLYFLAFWIAGLTGLRLLIAALYARTQNLLAAQVAHASYTGGFFMLWPIATSPAQDVMWTGVFALAYLVVATGVGLAVGRAAPQSRATALRLPT